MAPTIKADVVSPLPLVRPVTVGEPLVSVPVKVTVLAMPVPEIGIPASTLDMLAPGVAVAGPVIVTFADPLV